MTHMIDSLHYHCCGGVILGGGSGEQSHSACERCGAFQYDTDEGEFPTGTDAGANQEAWDGGDSRSPEAAADAAADEPLSLYVHIPFCDERCSYCGCNVVITKKREVAARYLDYLEREIAMLADHLPRRRRVSQYHWGGGTPTYLAPDQMERLHRRVVERFEVDAQGELAIEIDPRVTTPEQLALLRDLGFNRISMGVQDFDPRVQQAVNRNQSEPQTRAVYAACRELGFASINLDLIYGLPLQTPESFDRTMRSVVELRPDRLAVYSYAYVPWMKAHQKRIEVEELPAPAVKLRLFCIARERMLEAGYAPIGMDHFALPTDEMAAAVARRELYRNFMGYTVRMGTDMVGVGVSAIGDVRSSFAQNEKKLSTYYAALDAGRFPIERGYVLDEDDRIRRDVIRQLMCNAWLDRRDVERRFGIDFGTYFAAELAELTAPDGPVAHGFVEVGPDHLAVVGDGRLFLRNVCMTFDRYLRLKDPSARMFSRTV